MASEEWMHDDEKSPYIRTFFVITLAFH